MSSKRLLLIGVMLCFVTVHLACVSTSRYEKEIGALTDWLYRNQVPEPQSHYPNVRAWMEKITAVICDLENFDQAHKNKVRFPLCQAASLPDPIDPKSNPPPPPELPGLK